MSRRDMLARDRPRFDRHTALEPYAPSCATAMAKVAWGRQRWARKVPFQEAGNCLDRPTRRPTYHAGRRTEMMAAAGERYDVLVVGYMQPLRPPICAPPSTPATTCTSGAPPCSSATSGCSRARRTAGSTEPEIRRGGGLQPSPGKAHPRGLRGQVPPSCGPGRQRAAGLRPRRGAAHAMRTDEATIGTAVAVFRAYAAGNVAGRTSRPASGSARNGSARCSATRSTTAGCAATADATRSACLPPGVSPRPSTTSSGPGCRPCGRGNVAAEARASLAPTSWLGCSTAFCGRHIKSDGTMGSAATYRRRVHTGECEAWGRRAALLGRRGRSGRAPSPRS